MSVSKHTGALMAFALSAVSANALAQTGATIEEIADLNRKKVVVDLKKQIDAGKPVEVAIKSAAAPIFVAKKPDPADLVPDVLAIFGARPDQLSAVLSSPGQRDVRVVAGEGVTGGWVVERINTGNVVFRLAEPDQGKASAKKAAKGAPTVEPVPTYRRVTVAVGSQRHVLPSPAVAAAPSAGSNLPPPSPLMMQLPTPLPMVNTAGAR
jgi:hypothetical protein